MVGAVVASHLPLYAVAALVVVMTIGVVTADFGQLRPLETGAKRRCGSGCSYPTRTQPFHHQRFPAGSRWTVAMASSLLLAAMAVTEGVPAGTGGRRDVLVEGMYSTGRWVQNIHGVVRAGSRQRGVVAGTPRVP